MSGTDEEVEIRSGRATLEGHLMLPAGTGALIVFAHGSGSSRHVAEGRIDVKPNQVGVPLPGCCL